VNYSRLAAATTVLASLFIGCSAADKPAVTSTRTARTDAKLFAVSAESAAFFRHGPQAGREPDKTLPKETLVKLIRPSFGFSKVELAASGEQGYVASDDLRPASSALIASASAPKTDPLATAPAAEQFNLNSNDPRLVPPPEDLPPSELPAPAPEQ
jgi:hypothetical protein